MTVNEMFQLELIDLQLQANTEEELFKVVADRLLEREYVFPSYLTGITTREQSFPTGLITQHLNIALPHSDTEHVQKPFIYIARLEQPVLVRQMGDSQEMLVRDLFFLGIKDPTQQVGLLQLLMTMFQDEQFVLELKNEQQEKAVYELFTKKIAELEEEELCQKN